MSGCHFCLTPAFPDAYIVPHHTLRPTRYCCQQCQKDLQPENIDALPPHLVPGPQLLTVRLYVTYTLTPCLNPNSSMMKTEADYSKGSFPIMLDTERAVWAQVFRP